MRTKGWLCVAGAALTIGTLSTAEAAVLDARSKPPMVERAQSTVERPPPGGDDHRAVYLLSGSGLLAIGGIVLIGGVVGLGGLRIPGGVAMTVGRTRHWARSVRSTGVHRAGR